MEDNLEFYFKKYYPEYAVNNSLSIDEAKKNAISYTEKYGANKTIYESYWKGIFNSLFFENVQFPNMIFRKKFRFITLLGGCVFSQRILKRLQHCMAVIGDDKFAVIQDSNFASEDWKQNQIRVQYPANIKWEHLNAGDLLSYIILENSYDKHYYVLGNKGKWAMYAANDYVDSSVDPAGTPVNIIGFEEGYTQLFRDAFEIPVDSYCEDVSKIPFKINYSNSNISIKLPDLKNWVPKKYR